MIIAYIILQTYILIQIQSHHSKDISPSSSSSAPHSSITDKCDAARLNILLKDGINSLHSAVNSELVSLADGVDESGTNSGADNTKLIVLGVKFIGESIIGESNVESSLDEVLLCG